MASLQSSMKKHYKTYFVMLGIMIMINALALYEVCSLGNSGLYDEGGFIENVSASAFLFAGVLLLFLSLEKTGLERRLTQFFTVTCVVIFLREVDVEKLNVPAVLKFLGADTGRDILFVVLFLYIIIATILRHREGLVSKVKSCFASPVSITVLIGSAAVVLGAICEEMDYVFLEELLEMDGALLILLAAIVHIKEPIYKELQS